MPYALLLTILVLFLELGLWLPSQSNRRTWAALTLSLLMPASIWFVGSYPNGFALLFAVVAAYRSVNLARYIQMRRQPDHLYSVAKRTSSWLLAMQLLTLWLSVTASASSLHYGFVLLVMISVVGSIVLAAATQRNLHKTRPLRPATVADTVTPTISVLIPARNETEDLTACLQSLVQSNYEKLEIIVLDDCSQNKRTPEIIKGFAHAGVRFIAGGPVPDNWLAKNYAYDQLAQAASGDLLLFCGADTRFKPETLGVMVDELLQKQKTMISFVPANKAPRLFEYASLLVQPSRYAWELALPRRALDRPPVLSTAWLIRRETLEATGGFMAVPRAATPERMFARYAATHDDGYSFLQSDTEHGVASYKSFEDQRATAIRTRYPQLHQSLELTALVTVLELVLIVIPFVLYFTTLLSDNMKLFAIVDGACILLTIMYAQITALTYRRFILRSLWLLPIAALYDIILLNYSMYKYEFSSVDWKGRNVCIPVMQVINQLPKA
ncbi:MAG: glycosyltransferase family 2 protein [Patescibacteria group bacterium]|nr:glycosyltransferase family 2 protein [Patescibacteria group bacterium]